LPRLSGRPDISPPYYPDAERDAGIPGEVLVELTVDSSNRVTESKIVRATTPGYAQEVARSFRRRVTLPGVPAGVYSWSFLFYGSDDQSYEKFAQPGRFLVSCTSFGEPR
jgi:TonB family protein